MKITLVLMFFLLMTSNLFAVEPDEILQDKELEKRARIISKDLRCLVCQNENIDSSNAELAKDLRLLVRERILFGDSNKEVLDYIVKRYGQYVLLNPSFSGPSILLWISGPIVFILSICILILRFFYFRKKSTQNSTVHSIEDIKKLKSFLKK